MPKDPFSRRRTNIVVRFAARNIRFIRFKKIGRHFTRRRHDAECECSQPEQSSLWPVKYVAMMTGDDTMGEKRHNKYKTLIMFQGAL